VILTSESRDGIAFIKLSGKLVFDESLYKLRPKLRELLDSGTNAIIFDLGEVTHCDSSGMGEMIGAYTTIRKHDAAVAFANLTPKVRLLWERINIATVFDIFDTLAEAENFLATRRTPQK
jgi:anti-sigma B factor antagonist